MLAAHNGAPRSTRRLLAGAWEIRGQHFLADPAVRKNIRASLPLRPLIDVESQPDLAAELKKRQTEWPACLSPNGVFDPGIVSQWPVIDSRQCPHPHLHHFPILHHLLNFAPSIRSIHVVVQPEVTKQIVSPKAEDRAGEEEQMKKEYKEEFSVSGAELMDKVKKLIHEGTATKIIIKTESGQTVIEVPVVIGAVAVVLAPILAAVGAVAALLTRCTVVVVREKEEGK
jgi:Domain of unknown function (DUF4342)